MRARHQTITLTVLGDDPALIDAASRGDYAGIGRWTGDRTKDARRALLVVRPSDDTDTLWNRLRDSIIRLSGGTAADAGWLAGQIVNDLRRNPMPDAAHRCWTMAHLLDSPNTDPYAPRIARLRLIDTPKRRRRVRHLSAVQRIVRNSIVGKA